MASPSSPPPTNRGLLRRVSGTVRRLSSAERGQIPRLQTIFEGKMQNFGYDDDEEPVIMSASSVQLPPLSASAQQICLSSEIERELEKRNESTTSAEMEGSSSENKRPASPGVDSRDKDLPQIPGRLPRTSSLPKVASSSRLPISPSVNYIPDAGLRAALHQTLQAQTAFAAEATTNAEPSKSQFQSTPHEQSTPRVRFPFGEGTTDMAEALSHTLAISELTQQVQPGQIVSEVMREVVVLLKHPQSIARDRGIKAIINTIPRVLEVGAHPEMSEQDQRLLAVIRRLEETLELN